MDELSNQWYQAGSLLLQAGFLIAGVWSVRAILGDMRASQEQMAALLRLTLSADATGEESLGTAAQSKPYLLDLRPDDAAVSAAVNEQSQCQPRKSIWSSMAAWLQAPMANSGLSPWRRAVRWLQAPAGS